MPPAVKLSNHLVAFIDLLGFGSLVTARSAAEEAVNASKLLELHQSTKDKFQVPGMELVQFSDCIVISQPYEGSAIAGFLKTIADYQFGLLAVKMVCRGGVTVGRHLYEEGFLFSAALVEAYRLESTVARYPRIVISPDLLDLADPTRQLRQHWLVAQGDDGQFFVDFLRQRDFAAARASVAPMVSEHLTGDSRIREKFVWLARYFDYAAAGTAPVVASPMFTRP